MNIWYNRIAEGKNLSANFTRKGDNAMKITFVCKQATADDKLKSLFEKKVGKLDKFFRDEAEAFVTLSRYKDTEVLELTISMGGTLFRSEVEDESFYHGIDTAVAVIERQIRKNKTRLEKRMRSGAFIKETVPEPVEDVEEDKQFIIRQKTFNLRPMTTEEAILQMNLLEHTFFVYVNQDTDTVCVVYKRKDDTYGLIETDR